MNKIDCIIIDDEPMAQIILEDHISNLSDLNLVGKFLNAIDARNFLKHNTVDLIFLDLEMPKLKGFSFIRSLSEPPKIIITTAHREYALESYELEVLDYLLKPISFERFLVAINKVKVGIDNSQNKKHNYTYFKSGKKNIQVFFDDILFIEALGNYVKIHTINQIITTYDQLNDIIEKLPVNHFIRVHRSFIVALNKISTYGKDYIQVEEHQLSIGNTYKDSFNKAISIYK